jgi:enoyl-CoA hydratase
VVLETKSADGICEITLDRPAKRNALNAELRIALTAALRAADADSAVRVMLLTGADPAFCAGMDLDELTRTGLDATESGSYDEVLRAMTKPVIGAINGPASTGGLEIALGCDFLIASERARFGDSHARLGVFAGGGATVLLAQAVGVRMARQLTYTGEVIDAVRAWQLGLVNEVVAHQDLLPRARAIAALVATVEPDLLVAYKAAYWRVGNLSLDEALIAERQESVRRPVSGTRIAQGRTAPRDGPGPS